MKKFLTVAALIWVFFLLQTSVCPWIAFGSIKPNLLVILVASIGFMEGSKAGMWTGFACGLLADLFAANGVSLISQNGATPPSKSAFDTILHLQGSLCIARRSASFAASSGTPAISNITRPGLTTATQYSRAPLPEPIRVSAGLAVTGLSGKILIQT